MEVLFRKKRRSNITASVYLLTIIIVACIFPKPGSAQHNIAYFAEPTIHYKESSVAKFKLDFSDEAANDTLYMHISAHGYPVNYFRKIQANICFDNKCRLLDVNLYWNITGRYLGFELENGEFLSKSDHKPFNSTEYLRLHQILSDSLSPLSNYKFDDLIEKPPPVNSQVDALTSATAKNILEYVVEGAAYTTYKMWHYVYDSTRNAVINLTEKKLTPQLATIILASKDVSDKRWMLDRIHDKDELTNELMDEVIKLIGSDNYTLSERAVNCIPVRHLSNARLQVRLVKKMEEVDYSRKKNILARLSETTLTPGAAEKLAHEFKNGNAELIKLILDIFKRSSITQKSILYSIADLLTNENRFISGKAYQFLKGEQSGDSVLKKKRSAYESQHKDGL